MVAITKLFLSNRSQAVRIPADLRLPDSVKEVEVRACGQERIIAPVGRSWDSFFLDGPKVSDDFLVDRGSQEQSERDAF
ncbi:MAG: type II toxin-antitoxin system VapB family antitoxin [Synechococcaceae cyanobacterium ELA263]